MENNENSPCLLNPLALGGPCASTPLVVASSSPKKQNKKKKAKGRNGNIYIGVANRILWLQLQEKYGFENINNFGNFIMSYMTKVYEDFDMLHQVAVDIGMFEPQGLAGFRWVNGLPHPVNEIGEFIQLPEIPMSEEYSKRAFEITYDLCVKRGKFLVELASGIKDDEQSGIKDDEQSGIKDDEQSGIKDDEQSEAEMETQECLTPAPTKLDCDEKKALGKSLVELASGIKDDEESEAEMETQECSTPAPTKLDWDEKKALGKILGDITFESINSPEYFATPCAGPNNFKVKSHDL